MNCKWISRLKAKSRKLLNSSKGIETVEIMIVALTGLVCGILLMRGMVAVFKNGRFDKLDELMNQAIIKIESYKGAPT